MGYDLSAEATATDQELSADLEQLKGVSDVEIQKLLPDPADQQQLNDLIQAVNAATDQNQKVAAFNQKLGALSEGAMSVAKQLVKLA